MELIASLRTANLIGPEEVFTWRSTCRPGVFLLLCAFNELLSPLPACGTVVYRHVGGAFQRRAFLCVFWTLTTHSVSVSSSSGFHISPMLILDNQTLLEHVADAVELESWKLTLNAQQVVGGSFVTPSKSPQRRGPEVGLEKRSTCRPRTLLLLCAFYEL